MSVRERWAGRSRTLALVVGLCAVGACLSKCRRLVRVEHKTPHCRWLVHCVAQFPGGGNRAALRRERPEPVVERQRLAFSEVGNCAVVEQDPHCPPICRVGWYVLSRRFAAPVAGVLFKLQAVAELRDVLGELTELAVLVVIGEELK